MLIIIQNKKRIALSLFAVVIICATSCRKFVQIDTAPNLIQTSAVFSSDNTALAAVSGVYISLRSGLTTFTNSGMTINGGLAADELYATTPSANTNLFYLNQLTPANSVSGNYYSALYKSIYSANAIIEGLSQSVSLTDSLKRQLTGEMKMLRAMQYFYLVNLWGDVPLVTTTDYIINAVMPRTPVQQAYHQIVADLTEAQNLLKTAYPSTGKARPNKWTATALLARVYLYQHDWVNAETQSSAIINSGMYSMVSTANIGNVFLKNSTETIWEIATPNEGPSVVGEASAFIPSSATIKPTYALTPNLLSAFENGDKRNQTNGWTGKNTISGQDYYYPYKYKQRTIATGGTTGEYNVVFRLAEQYLIRAEARAQLNNIPDAQDDLNKIRNRAGLLNTTASTQALLLSAIEKERQVEFFAEWGHRWLDLKRTAKADIILGPVKGSNWQSTDILWPIPEVEITYNPSLVQNPGY